MGYATLVCNMAVGSIKWLPNIVWEGRHDNNHISHQVPFGQDNLDIVSYAQLDN